MNRVKQKVRQLGRITRAVINTSNEVKCRLLWEFLIYNFSRRILERVFVGSIVNIRNECLFVWVHGEWIVVHTNKSPENRFMVHAIYLSRATIHSQWTQKKIHSFLNRQGLILPQSTQTDKPKLDPPDILFWGHEKCCIDLNVAIPRRIWINFIVSWVSFFFL